MPGLLRSLLHEIMEDYMINAILRLGLQTTLFWIASRQGILSFLAENGSNTFHFLFIITYFDCQFLRRYHQHIPAAITIKIYQSLHGEYDHAGIVIVDKEGVPLLFENTLFGGRKLRRLDDRIMYSSSVYIGTIPLAPRDSFSREEQNKLLSFASEQSSGASSQNELQEQFSLLWNEFRQTTWARLTKATQTNSNENNKKTLNLCSNMKLLVESLGVLGVTVRSGGDRVNQRSDEVLSLADIANRGLKLSKEMDTNADGSSKSSSKLTLGRRILIKTT